MIDDLLHSLATSPWALVAMAALVLADAFLIVVPGEVIVTTLGALAVSAGSPPLALVIAVAALAAWCGDVLCCLIGRSVGLHRWRWMRGRRITAAFAWASDRLGRRMTVIVFTARFIPFARLAVNLTAGATRVPLARYLAVAGAAALGWAAYQAVIGAAVALLVPGPPIAGIVVSVVLALTVGTVVDALVSRLDRRRAARGASAASGA